MKSALRMVHAEDPAKTILDKVGDLSDFEVMHNDILVGVYIRPDKTAGGIYLSDGVRKEDEYQGTVGLVLKKGPMAFVDDGAAEFHGQNIEVGDWIAFRVGDAWSISIRGALCRMIEDRLVKMKIPAPDEVY